MEDRIIALEATLAALERSRSMELALMSAALFGLAILNVCTLLWMWKQREENQLQLRTTRHQTDVFELGLGPGVQQPQETDTLLRARVATLDQTVAGVQAERIPPPEEDNSDAEFEFDQLEKSGVRLKDENGTVERTYQLDPDGEGNLYFYSPLTGATTWEDPEPDLPIDYILPPGAFFSDEANCWKVLLPLPPQQQQSAMEQVQQAKVMFLRYDADKSGSIDGNELQLLLADMDRLEVDPTILKRHDTDSTDSYDFDQFVALYNELCGGEVLIHKHAL
jgi:hypothetical protein